jgi:hypothetical protein
MNARMNAKIIDTTTTRIRATMPGNKLANRARSLSVDCAKACFT